MKNATIETIVKATLTMSNLDLAAMVDKEFASVELATRFAVGDDDNMKYAAAMVSLKQLCKDFYQIDNATEINKTRLFQRVKAQVAKLCPKKDVRKSVTPKFDLNTLFTALQCKAVDNDQLALFKELCAKVAN